MAALLALGTLVRWLTAELATAKGKRRGLEEYRESSHRGQPWLTPDLRKPVHPWFCSPHTASRSRFKKPTFRGAWLTQSHFLGWAL